MPPFNFLFKSHFSSLFMITFITFLNQSSIAQSDAELINAVLRGDVETLEELIEAGEGRVRGWFCRDTSYWCY